MFRPENFVDSLSMFVCLYHDMLPFIALIRLLLEYFTTLRENISSVKFKILCMPTMISLTQHNLSSGKLPRQ